MKRVVRFPSPGTMTPPSHEQVRVLRTRTRGSSVSKAEFILMRQLLVKLWNDDCGALIASEFLFVATILVIGTVVGLSNVRDAVNAELTEFGNALLALSQGYTISGVSGCSATTDGSAALDTPQLLTPPTHTPPAIPSIIDVTPC